MHKTLAIGVLLQLRGKNISPDITRCCAEGEWHTVLASLQFMDQFNSGKYPPGMLERFEAQHG